MINPCRLQLFQSLIQLGKASLKKLLTLSDDKHRETYNQLVGLHTDTQTDSPSSLGIERSLGSDPGVRVFAHQYPTVIRSAVVLANLKDNIELI